MKAAVFFDGNFAAIDWEDQLVRFPSRKHIHVENVQKNIEVVLKNETPKGRARQTTVTAHRETEEEEQTPKRTAASLVHLNRHAFYDPSLMGKVEGIDFYMEMMNVDSTPGVEVNYAIVLQQDGVLFQSPPARLSGSKKWKGFISESLTSDDFMRVGKPTVTSFQTRPDFSRQAPAMRFGYVVHVTSADPSMTSVTRICEWKVSVAHREDPNFSLSQTQEYKLRLDQEVLERQRLERAIVEQRIKSEQELREVKLKAEQELNSLRMSLSLADRELLSAAPCSPLTRTDDLSHLISGEMSPLSAVEDRYISIVRAAQSRLQEVDTRRKAERQRKERLEEERENMRKTIDLERQGREEAERKWTAQFQEATKTAEEEKLRLNEELAGYRKRIFTLEQELSSECKVRNQKEEELRRALEELATRQRRMLELTDEIEALSASMATREAESELAKQREEQLLNQILQLEAALDELNVRLRETERQNADLEAQVRECSSLLDNREREWNELGALKDLELAEALKKAEEIGIEIRTWEDRAQRQREQHAKEVEALQEQLEQKQVQVEQELQKAADAHTRKEEAWKRTAMELNGKLKSLTHALSEAEESLKRKEEQMDDLVHQLDSSRQQVEQHVEVAESLRQTQAAMEKSLKEANEAQQGEIESLHRKLKQIEEAREQEQWLAQLEQTEIKRKADAEIQGILREHENALAKERQTSAEYAQKLAALQEELSAASSKAAAYNDAVDELKTDLAACKQQREELHSAVAQLEDHLELKSRALDALKDQALNSEEGAEKLQARLDVEIKRNKELQHALTAVTSERAKFAEEMKAELQSKKQTIKELESYQDNYEHEKMLREKIARELFAEIDARKEGEKRQASVIAALNEHLKKQAEAIIQLDLALKQEQADRLKLEEDLEAESLARIKAEEALRKLDEIFKHTAKEEEDAEWELVTEGKGHQ